MSEKASRRMSEKSDALGLFWNWMLWLRAAPLYKRKAAVQRTRKRNNPARAKKILRHGRVGTGGFCGKTKISGEISGSGKCVG